MNQQNYILSIMAESYSLYDKDYCMPVFGLHNTGAICWFNSLLQAIFSLPSINERLLSLNQTSESGNNSAPQNQQNALIHVMKQVLSKCLPRSAKMLDSSPNIHQLESASKEILMGFGIELRKNNKILDITTQQGATDGICSFFEMLDDTDINNIIFNKYRKTIDCELCGKQNVSDVNDFSPIINVFADNDLTTEELFVTYIKRRLVPVYGYKCEHCDKVMNKTMRFENIRRLSEVIIISFAFVTGNKYFPPNMSFLNAAGQMMRYKAVAQIEHSGSYDMRTHNSSGHYYARCTRNVTMEPTDYYLLNDLSASPIPRDTGALKATPQTHIVFYHMCGVEAPTKEEQIKYEAAINKIKMLSG